MTVFSLKNLPLTVSLVLLPQCAVGSEVDMRVGGDFFFDPSPSDPPVDLLLVAGGVGINPLYSILLHTADLLRLQQTSSGQDSNVSSVHLCYSAKNSQELLFKVCVCVCGRALPWVSGRHVVECSNRCLSV